MYAVEDLSAEDIRDLLRRERVAPAIVDSVWRKGISGAALQELSVSELEGLGFAASFAAQLGRMRDRLLSDPGWAHRLSEVQADATQKLSAFYRGAGAPDKANGAAKILCSHADDPAVLHKKLLAKYPDQADDLGFLRSLINDHAHHVQQMSALTKRLGNVFRVRGIENESPQELLQSYLDAPWQLLDHLMQKYLIRPQELVFLSEWSAEVERDEICTRAQVAAMKKPLSSSGVPPPPPPGAPPEWARRSGNEGPPVGSSGGGGDSETTRLRFVLASCREELRRQRKASAQLHEEHQATVRDLHAVNKARHEDLAHLHELRMKVASLEQVVQHRDSEILRLAKRDEVNALQRELQQSQEAIIGSHMRRTSQSPQPDHFSPPPYPHM